MIVYRELSSLERDLGIPAKTLYAVSNSLSRHYRMVSIPKKTGGARNLMVPDTALKTIQRRISDVLLAHMPVSSYATAYRFGTCTLRNAAVHVGKPVVLKLDIYHFFDSIPYSLVKEKAFPAHIYAEQIRTLLTMLCYHKDVLPQGAPSSPAIVNIILADFDERIGRWCTQRGIAYTRYCDDLTFSGDFDPKEVIKFVVAQLKSLGLLLNTNKTRVQRQGQQQLVTGVIVNEKPGVPAIYRRQLRQEMHYCQKFGVGEHLKFLGQGISEEAYLRQLLGKVNYVLHIVPDCEEFQQYRTWILQKLQNISPAK